MERQAFTASSELPARVRALLWEYDADNLTWETDRDLIVARVLSRGDWDAVVWLRSRMGDAALRTWIEQRQGATLTPRQLRFWELVLTLPSRQVDAWIAHRRQTVWGQRITP